MGINKKTAIRFGIFSISIGVIALLNPDGGAIYVTAGEGWLNGFFISTIWGTPLGVGMTTIGTSALLFGVFSSDDDRD